MTSLFCTQGHGNPTNNRFCQECGQPLMIDNRYRIVRHLGQGGFGRTFLAENIKRNNDRCVLKEFAPQVSNPEQLKKAEELFEREASVLSKLQHNQIPHLQERFRTTIGGKEYLFLVEEYIEGDTYWNLLATRKQQGSKFSEAEVIELMRQILPVLSYIHSQNPQVIHRDISPDNLILRRSDRHPVLIDFGGVKQLQAAVGLGVLSPQAVLSTRLGKPGYAPEEQLRQGKVSPSSDLYALAVTGLVLLTGEEPQVLYDAHKGMWRWGEKINLPPQLEVVFKRMLAYKPSDRYLSAAEAIQAFTSINSAPSPQHHISQIRTVIVAPGNKSTPQNPPIPNKPSSHKQPSNNNNGQHQGPQIVLPTLPTIPPWLRKFGIRVMGAGLLIVVGMGALSALNSLIHSKPSKSGETTQENLLSTSAEQTRIDKIISRRKDLGISTNVFNDRVNRKFYAKHPELRRRPLKPGQEDAALREEWHQIAEAMLDKLEQRKQRSRE